VRLPKTQSPPHNLEADIAKPVVPVGCPPLLQGRRKVLKRGVGEPTPVRWIGKSAHAAEIRHLNHQSAAGREGPPDLSHHGGQVVKVF